MTIRRNPRPRRLRRGLALCLAGAVLYLVWATAASSSAQAAVDQLSRRRELALTLLRCQLGDRAREDDLPAQVALAIGQSPLLLAGKEAVLELRQTEENDASGSPGEPERLPDRGGAQILPEEPAEPEDTLLQIDNGVPARTLVPASSEGYVVAGGVYINNRTELPLDAAMLEGDFDAALAEEEGPQVLILHTHATEAYTMPPGQEYTPSGECRCTDPDCNMLRVGEALKAALEAEGLQVLHDGTLHDYPEYSGAYDRSLTTAQSYLEQYPTIRFILDVHRDAIYDTQGNPYKVVSPVAGLSAAQMSFVIGSDGGGLEHPRWLENLKLAAAVQRRLTEDYPTLMRPITLRSSRYNQHLTTGCLLVEVGAAGNSLDEALVSAGLLGKALAEVIQTPPPA